MSSFDPHLVIPGPGGAELIKGEFTRVQCIDPASSFPPLSQGNHVLDGSKPFYIDMEWQLSGSLAPLWLAALTPGSWRVEAFAESIGPGPEVQCGQTAVTADPGQMTYTARIEVSPNTLPEGNPGRNGPSGQYKISCSCFLNSNLGANPYDITGFIEGPLIRIENPI